MAIRSSKIGVITLIGLAVISFITSGDVRADPEKAPKKDFLVATGLTNETVVAVANILQTNKIPFSTEGVIGEGERFEVTGNQEANQAFTLVKSLKSKFPQDALVIPDKLIGRTELDYCAIGLTYDVKADALILKVSISQGLPEIVLNGDGVAGYSIECKKEVSTKSIAMLHDFAKAHPEVRIQIFDKPYPVYQYDEPVPSVNVKM